MNNWRNRKGPANFLAASVWLVEIPSSISGRNHLDSLLMKFYMKENF